MLQVEYVELSELEQAQVDDLTNDTIGKQNFFLIPDGEVIAIEASLRELFEAQNREAITPGDIREIV